MKRIALLALLALALPLSAFANSTWDFTNIDGTLTGNVLGLSLAGSDVINIEGPGGPFACPCTEDFTTALGVFTISDAFGVIFNGTFTSPVVLVSEGNGIYQISAYVAGTLTLPNGNTKAVTGFTSQLYLATGAIAAGTFSSQFGSGDTILATPEPGTLALLGTGLLGLAGVARKKLKT
jgi:hypothetical protein